MDQLVAQDRRDRIHRIQNTLTKRSLSSHENGSTGRYIVVRLLGGSLETSSDRIGKAAESVGESVGGSLEKGSSLRSNQDYAPWAYTLGKGILNTMNPIAAVLSDQLIHADAT